MRAEAIVDEQFLAELAASGLYEPQTLWDLAIAAPAERTAVVCPANGEIDYRTLIEEAVALAAQWQDEGMRPGDVVIVQLPNCYEFVLAHLALTRLGAITLAVPTNYRGTELAVIASGSHARGVVCCPSHRACPDAEVYEHLRESVPSVTHLWVTEGGALRAAAGRQPRATLPPPPEPDEVTIIMSTSGTTGTPKLVLHTHRGTVGGTLQAIAGEMGIDSSDVLFAPSPLAHASGLQYGVRLAVALGTTLLLLDRWDPEKAADLIERYRATWTLGATPFLYDLSRLPGHDRRRLESLRVFACGGAPIPPSIARAAREALPNVAICPVWGMSETGMVTVVRPGDPAEKIVSSDGRVVPGWQLRIRTVDGRDAATNEVGEIQVRGAALFHGYYQRPDLTAATVPDGWMRTGDLGYLDEDGFLRCQGRIKDLIIRGGVNISAGEVEDEVRSHPQIADVAIIGIPDPRLGERVGAIVIPAAGADQVPSVEELDAYLTGRGLARNKHPEHIMVVDEFPTTPAGKVQKHLLRARFAPSGATTG
jgi:acyl-CoA synthetase (AMP-forming)/AMP-acid ligase II